MDATVTDKQEHNVHVSLANWEIAKEEQRQNVEILSVSMLHDDHDDFAQRDAVVFRRVDLVLVPVHYRCSSDAEQRVIMQGKREP